MSSSKKGRSFTVNGLEPNTKYHIQIRGKNNAGDHTKWSKTYTFTTVKDSVDLDYRVLVDFVYVNEEDGTGILWATPEIPTPDHNNKDMTNADFFKVLYEVSFHDRDGLISDIGHVPHDLDNVDVDNSYYIAYMTAGAPVVERLSSVVDGYTNLVPRIRAVYRDGSVGDWVWPPGGV